MKKTVFSLILCLIAIGLNAQNEKLIGKWNIFEMTAEGKTFSLDKLKEFGKDKDYIEILAEGKLKMFDDNIVLDGNWEFLKEENILKVVILPSEEAKARGEGISTMKYTVEQLSDENLTLKLGKYMTSKYVKEVESE